MYDIKNLNIWKESHRDNPLLIKPIVLEIDASLREVFMEKNSDFGKIKTIFDEANLADVNRRAGAKFHFQIYMTDKLENTGIDALELSVRSYNCLKRAGINTIGDLCNKIKSSSELHSIRNCGKTSVAEIMDNLFAYHFLQLDVSRRYEYLNKIISLNQSKEHNN